MKGDFENNIKNKLSDFKIEPSAQVWPGVEDALRQRRKRRISGMRWFAIPIFLFLIGGGIWLMNNKALTTSSNSVIAINLKSITTNKQKTDSLVAAGMGTNSVERDKRMQQNPTTITRIEKNNNALVHSEKSYQSHGRNNSEKGNNHLNTIVPSVVQKDKQDKKTLTSKRAKTSSAELVKVSKTDNLDKSVSMKSIKKDSSLFNLSTRANNATAPPEETANTAPSNTNIGDVKADNESSFSKKPLASDKQKDSSFPNSNAAVKNDHKQINKSKHQWFITAAGGFINVKEGTSLFASNQNYYSASPSNSVGNGASSGNPGNSFIPAPNKGYSFEAGFGYSQNFDKRWIASAGLQYRYFQNRQSVGFDSLAINTAQLYFSYIQNNAYITNYAHFLQLPVSLSYVLNPTSRFQLQLSGGGSVAWAFSENWLITDKNNTSYPYHNNNALNNRLIANLQVGIGVNCNDKFKISLLAGQSLTPIHKNSTEKFYWQQFSLQISKPLHLISHQNKKNKN